MASLDTSIGNEFNMTAAELVLFDLAGSAGKEALGEGEIYKGNAGRLLNGNIAGEG